MLLFFLIALLSAMVQVWLPWWYLVIVAAVMSLLVGRSFRHAFLSGFLACGLVWLVYALVIGITQGNLMTVRIAELFILPASALLYVISFLIAAAGGGLGAVLGFSLKRIFIDTN